MAAKAWKRAPDNDVKPLTEERKHLIERYMVDAEEAERLDRDRAAKAEAPAVEAGQPARDGAEEPEAPAVAAEKPVRDRAEESEAPPVPALQLVRDPAEEADVPAVEAEKPIRRRRAAKPKTSAGETQKPVRRRRAAKPQASATGAEKPARRGRAATPKAPVAEAAPSGARAEADAVELSGSAAEADPPEAGFEGQARPVAEADERRQTDEQALLVAAAEVRRLTDELTRLAAEAEARTVAPPAETAAAQAGGSVEAQSTLKAADVPIDVPPVEQTDVCFVALWRGYRTCEFFARRPDGAIVATSGSFRWRKPDPPPEDGPAREAFDRLVAELATYEWEERGRGALWYERRFEREAHSAYSEWDRAVTKSPR